MAEFRRKFYDRLLRWKLEKHQECLLVKGARQIGKTFIIEKFGHEQYESFIEFNFVLDPEACSIFDGSLKAEDLYRKISAYDATRRLLPGRTLIFLDEIQECPNARTALKSFALDGRYDVVASGSLLGIKHKNKKSRMKSEPKSIPVGYERQVVMHSMDFEEFLWARGVTEDAIAALKEFHDAMEPVPDAVNRRYTDLVREYMIVGGMPAVVKAYVEAGDFGPVQDEQNKILASYIDDIHKYADSTDIPKIEACYRAIPRILAKDNRKFKYAEVEKGGSERKYGASVDWLCDAALASRAVNVTVPELPLNAHVLDDRFKLYLSDVGLLSAMYGAETKRLLYSGKLVGNAKGGLYENLVAGMIERVGLPLFYFKTEDGSREVEFLLERDGGVVPVEVKSSNGATVSLNELLDKPGIPQGYKFVDGNVGVVGKKRTMPHYMAMFEFQIPSVPQSEGV
ncbi:MAG: ATP-binding protein [Lentisphaerae bacterium]|nr:ATP-binding protein [Lentisphaerota bacterium]